MNTAVKWAAWLLALFMIMMGVMKFLPDNPPIFQIIENNVGLDFINPTFKYLTALLEIVAGMLLFVNRPKGVLLSLIIIGGAIGAHLTVLGIYTPTGPEIDSATSPMLFIMALVSFAVTAFVWWGSRAKKA